LNKKFRNFRDQIENGHALSKTAPLQAYAVLLLPPLKLQIRLQRREEIKMPAS
jgi:hypothetical protein